jgi:hypothetical protein
MRLEEDVEIKIIVYLLLLVNNQLLVQRGKEGAPMKAHVQIYFNFSINLFF